MLPMRNIFRILITLFFNLYYLTLSGQLVEIKGRLLRNEDSLPVYGAVVTLKPDMKSSDTNQKGEFRLVTTTGRKELTARFLGYKQYKIIFYINSDTTFNLFLEIDPIMIKEITVISDSVKSIEHSEQGNIILSRASMREVPRYFSEPDLIKFIQTLPGVVQGKDGTVDFFVRGGSMGQNVFLVNGCYFFLPSHLLGLTSSFDLDFIDKTELIKDYFPPDIGGGASSVVKIEHRIPKSDSAGVQLRLGLITSGLTFQIPLHKIKLGISGGIKRGNYSVYAPLLKKLLNKKISDFLPPNDYSFYDSYMRITHLSSKSGTLSYVYMRNYDNGSKSSITDCNIGDTLLKSETGFMSLWLNQVHSLQWTFPAKGNTTWIYDLNFNEISVWKENFLKSKKFINDSALVESKDNSYRISPHIINIGSKIFFIHTENTFGFSGGVYYRLRYFNPNISATYVREEQTRVTSFVSEYMISEPAIFLSSNFKLSSEWLFEGGVRLSAGFVEKTCFINFEPRLRLTHESSGNFFQHVNFVRLTQFDHSLESSNVGLRSLLWIPVNRELGPERSDVYSAGVNGQIKNYVWSADIYLKFMHGMVDFKPGASLFNATSINDLLDKIRGRAYGFEIFFIRRTGRITGNLTYTYSRSKREWYAPEGRIWIPSVADRPHNINISLKYYWKSRTSFGINWVYSSGLPATLYTHTTSFGEWFETKNNIRYPDYHRLDISVRKTFKLKNAFFNLDFDIANVYNRKNTFYLERIFDEKRKIYIYKNVSLFPIMPSFSLSLEKSWYIK